MKRFKQYLNSPIGIFIVLLFLLNLVSGAYTNPIDWIMRKLLMLPGIIIGLSVHEWAHGFVSSRLGDPTPKLQGRLTLNPAAHIDPIGFLSLLICGFGWGIPVEIDARYYKHRRAGEMMVAFAGVLMNFITAIVFILIVKGIYSTAATFAVSAVGGIIIEILLYIVQINVVLMAFNLLPIPPLDGFNIVTEIFNLRKYGWWYKVYRYGFIILLACVMFNITGILLNAPIRAMYGLLLNILYM